MIIKPPVITIDGPSGSGKGTISQLLASKLGFNYLDSGALYRLVAMAAKRHGVALDNVEALAVLAAHMDIAFEMDSQGGSPKVVLETENVSELIRGENVGAQASMVAAFPEVRSALLQRQKAFARKPGLVADGRDMGTVIFPDAEVKVFLTASAQARAERRYKQLIDKGESGSLRDLVEKVESRDERDRTRAVAPLLPAEDAITVDSTALSIAEVLDVVLNAVTQRLKI
ncbi:MAG: (d)CMP kinase [Porticoccaceae bacterium]|nr:(d)CMP kinase [Porticoccaceae bacterium]